MAASENTSQNVSSKTPSEYLRYLTIPSAYDSAVGLTDNAVAAASSEAIVARRLSLRARRFRAIMGYEGFFRSHTPLCAS
jgi:hypothetical protein